MSCAAGGLQTASAVLGDVIIERPSGEIVGLEIKASATVRADDFAGLRHLRERVGERMVGGAILYAGDEPNERRGPGIGATAPSTARSLTRGDARWNLYERHQRGSQ